MSPCATVPEWLAEMLVRNQNSPGKPPFDREAYERERLAKHAVGLEDGKEHYET